MQSQLPYGEQSYVGTKCKKIQPGTSYLQNCMSSVGCLVSSLSPDTNIYSFPPFPNTMECEMIGIRKCIWCFPSSVRIQVCGQVILRAITVGQYQYQNSSLVKISTVESWKAQHVEVSTWHLWREIEEPCFVASNTPTMWHNLLGIALGN